MCRLDCFKTVKIPKFVTLGKVWSSPHSHGAAALPCLPLEDGPEVAVAPCSGDAVAPLLLYVPRACQPLRGGSCLHIPACGSGMCCTASPRDGHIPALQAGFMQAVNWSIGPWQCTWVKTPINVHRIMRDVGLFGVLSYIFVSPLGSKDETHICNEEGAF